VGSSLPIRDSKDVRDEGLPIRVAVRSLVRGLAGGRVIVRDGAWPGLAPANRYAGQALQVTTDFRDVYAEALNRYTGLATAQMGTIFPSFTVSASRFPGLFV
jgi:uncharacterized protein (DUF1501 family)